MIWTFWTRRKFLMPTQNEPYTIQPTVYSLHKLSYSSSHCLILVILYAQELVLKLINCVNYCVSSKPVS